MPDTTHTAVQDGRPAVRPDIRLDRETWDGRLQVETITRRGIEAFAPYNSEWRAWQLGWFRTDEYPNGTVSQLTHDACLRAYIRHAGLTVEGE